MDKSAGDSAGTQDKRAPTLNDISTTMRRLTDQYVARHGRRPVIDDDAMHGADEALRGGE